MNTIREEYTIIHDKYRELHPGHICTVNCYEEYLENEIKELHGIIKNEIKKVFEVQQKGKKSCMPFTRLYM